MLIFPKPLPLSLYIHIPWCVRKCPYCDFNSHEIKSTAGIAHQSNLPEELYTTALIQELDSRLHLLHQRPIKSIFFGGGTPSLFSAQAIAKILDGITQRMSVSSDIEITLEANPGTAEQLRFQDFYAAGINRLSLGIQSLQDDKLRTLGRIHDSQQAMQAIRMAKKAGFCNINLDLMYGLPNQTIAEAIQDLEAALQFEPAHLSWYQLTIEPNTVFYRQKPVLPSDELTWETFQIGQAHLQQSGFQQYEISAYAQTQKECAHNRNYWEFGDYLGLGAGAHSKITDHHSGHVLRFAQVRQPKDYLIAQKRHTLNTLQVKKEELIFEFMLNALRLIEGVPATCFTEHTGLGLKDLEPTLSQAKQRGLVLDCTDRLCTTNLGSRFLNNVTELFLNSA